MFVGQMACEGLNFILKRVIKEERPKGRCHIGRNIEAQLTRGTEMFGKGYGMPSSHAQFMTFFSVYLTFFLLFRHSKASASSYPNVAVLLRFLVMLALCLGAAGVAASRIYLNYHTPKQVLAGCAAGFTCACGWFLITSVLRRTGWIEWGLELTVSRLMRVRDLVVSEDLAEAGWQRWETQRLKLRGSKKGKKSA